MSESVPSRFAPLNPQEQQPLCHCRCEELLRQLLAGNNGFAGGTDQDNDFDRAALIARAKALVAEVMRARDPAAALSYAQGCLTQMARYAAELLLPVAQARALAIGPPQNLG